MGYLEFPWEPACHWLPDISREAKGNSRKLWSDLSQKFEAQLEKQSYLSKAEDIACVKNHGKLVFLPTLRWFKAIKAQFTMPEKV